MGHTFHRLALTWVSALLIVVCASAPVFAAEDGTFYGKLSFGAATASDFPNNNAAATARFSPKTGWDIEAALGYRISNQFRLELDMGHRHQGMGGTFARNSRIACGGSSVPCLNGAVEGGSLKATSALAAVAWDIPLEAAFKPYVEAGAGPMKLSLHARTTGTFATGPSQQVELIGDSDGVIAYRLGAGIGIELRPFTLTVGYNYTSSTKTRLEGHAPVAPVIVNRHLKSHAVGVGALMPF